jgi:hypothetical protein
LDFASVWTRTQSTGLSATDVVSVALAAGAFVLAVASLWLTSLRRARVDVDRITSSAPEIMVASWDGAMPAATMVRLVLFAANSGATGTVVEDFAMARITEHNDDTPLWTNFETGPHGGKGFATPFLLERDDAQAGSVRRNLTWNPDAPPREPAEFARRLATVRSFSVTLEWTYRRQRFPQVRQRERAHATTTVVIDAHELREMAKAHWRQFPDYAGLAEIAEGQEPAAW